MQKNCKTNGINHIKRLKYININNKYIKTFAYYNNSLYLCIVIKKQMLLIKMVRHTVKTVRQDDYIK